MKRQDINWPIWFIIILIIFGYLIKEGMTDSEIVEFNILVIIIMMIIEDIYLRRK